MNTTILRGRFRTLAELVIALLVAAGIAVASASANHANTASIQKPTIVLVHGGWADASCEGQRVDRPSGPRCKPV